MQFSLGIKSDPILYRYSYEWLFGFMQRNDLHYMQLGTFFELYSLDLEYFRDLKKSAEAYEVSISSCFTAHRELGGFFTGNSYFEKAALKNYKRFIDAASTLGSAYVGSNPGALFRDQPESKPAGIKSYLENMKELMKYAHGKGLKGLTIEPMSCTMEPPSLPDEITYMMNTLGEFHDTHTDTVPVYLCGDTSHGVRDQRGKILTDNETLFKHGIPYMCEFHIKNTDTMYNSTFGFSQTDPDKGIVDLDRFMGHVFDNEALWPVEHVVGYLEIGGPKLGRDYSDHLLEKDLQESIDTIKIAFNKKTKEIVR